MPSVVSGLPIARYMVETDIEAEELKPSDNEMRSTIMSVPASALWQYIGNVAIFAACLLILLCGIPRKLNTNDLFVQLHCICH